MPNWVRNNLSITGAEEEVQKVKARLAAPYERVYMKYTDKKVESETVTVEKDFSFWNIVHPEGEDRVKYDESLVAPGASSFWYDWNCNNWGTKWDAEAELTEHSADHLQYSFDTAWAPPVEAMTTLSKNFTSVHVELDWEEEQGFGGTFAFRNGEVSILDEYDIPSSHAELKDRKGFCYCEGDSEAYFADCPVADPEMLIPSDEIAIEALV